MHCTDKSGFGEVGFSEGNSLISQEKALVKTLQLRDRGKDTGLPARQLAPAELPDDRTKSAQWGQKFRLGARGPKEARSRLGRDLRRVVAGISVRGSTSVGRRGLKQIPRVRCAGLRVHCTDNRAAENIFPAGILIPPCGRRIFVISLRVNCAKELALLIFTETADSSSSRRPGLLRMPVPKGSSAACHAADGVWPG